MKMTDSKKCDSICAFSMVFEYLSWVPPFHDMMSCDSVGPPQFGFIYSMKVKAFQKCSEVVLMILSDSMEMKYRELT